MKLGRKLSLAALFAASGLMIGGGADAANLPGWAGSADPFSEAACWYQSYGRLHYESGSCGSETIWDDFSIPIPVKQSLGLGSDSVTVAWETGTDCSGGICIGDLQAKVLVFNSNGTLSSASSWVTTTGTHSVGPLSIPANGTVQLWVQAKGAINDSWLSRVSTSGNLSL